MLETGFASLCIQAPVNPSSLPNSECSPAQITPALFPCVLTHILGDKCPQRQHPAVQASLPTGYSPSQTTASLQLSPKPPVCPMRAAHRRARAQHTFPCFPQHWSHQDLTEGLGVLGAEGGEGSHEVAGGRLCEGQDLWREKNRRWGLHVRKQGRKKGRDNLGDLCPGTYSLEEELLSQDGCAGVAEVGCESQQPATEPHQELLWACGKLEEGAQPLELGTAEGTGTLGTAAGPLQL